MATAPQITQAVDDVAPVTGPVFYGDYTNDASPVVRVSLGDQAVTGQVLRLSDDAPVGLGVVALGSDYVIGISSRWAATMVAGTTTVDGLPATTVTLTLTDSILFGGLRTAPSTSTMRWSVSSPTSPVLSRSMRTSRKFPMARRIEPMARPSVSG